ncbi:MAG TPA: hypothetical protein VEB21_18510, partial [Terriglobales bacterium]|nr:hypothetical protein [Terriglobales bacterium]
AAMLNVASGADANAISDTIAEANAWLAANALGSNPRNGSRAVGIELAATLDEYNNGRLGPDHCD